MDRRTRRRATTAVTLCGLAGSAALAVRYAQAGLAVPAGLFLAFVLPGGALGALMRDRLSAVERLVLPPALSLATLVLGGLVVDAAGFRLTRTSWTVLLVTVTLVSAGLGWLRGRGAPVAGTGWSWPGARAVTRAAAPLTLGLAVLGVAVWLSLDSATTRSPAAVTALSVTPVGDTADHRTLVVGLTSGEKATTAFTVRVNGADDFESTVDVSLARAGSWKRTLTVPSGDVTVELYRPGESEPYRSAFLEEAS